MFNDAALLKSVFSGNQTAIDTAKEEYGKFMEAEVAIVPNGNDDKERVFDAEHPFVEDRGKIAPQVSQVPKQNVPTLNNGNK